MTQSKKNSLSYCAEQVRKCDHDRYLMCLFMPEAAREACFALLAFNLELARIPEAVREPMIGHIRYAWWRECIAEIYEGKPVRQHPVAEALAACIRAHALQREWFDALVDAREEDYATEGYATLEALQEHCAAVEYPLLALLCTVSRETLDEEACRQVAGGYGLIGMMRSVGFHHRIGRVYLPHLLLSKHSNPQNDAQNPPEIAVVSAVVKTICEEITPSVLRNMQAGKAETQGRWMRLYARTSGHFLKKIRAANYNVLHPAMETGRAMLIVKMLLWTSFARH